MHRPACPAAVEAPPSPEKKGGVCSHGCPTVLCCCKGADILKREMCAGQNTDVVQAAPSLASTDDFLMYRVALNSMRNGPKGHGFASGDGSCIDWCQRHVLRVFFCSLSSGCLGYGSIVLVAAVACHDLSVLAWACLGWSFLSFLFLAFVESGNDSTRAKNLNEPSRSPEPHFCSLAYQTSVYLHVSSSLLFLALAFGLKMLRFNGSSPHP